MNRSIYGTLVGLLVCAAAGCSSSTSAPTPSTVAATDSGIRAAILPDGGTCSYSGAVACDTTLGAMCARFVQCCDANDGSCAHWATDVDLCKSHWLENGYNCASTDFANTRVCSSTMTSCQNDIPLISCPDIENGTANWPASCNTFWSQYK
jgi:hypothetical protein